MCRLSGITAWELTENLDGMSMKTGVALPGFHLFSFQRLSTASHVRNTEQLGQKDQVQSAFHRNYNCTDTIGVKQATEWHGA